MNSDTAKTSDTISYTFITYMLRLLISDQGILCITILMEHAMVNINRATLAILVLSISTSLNQSYQETRRGFSAELLTFIVTKTDQTRGKDAPPVSIYFHPNNQTIDIKEVWVIFVITVVFVISVISISHTTHICDVRSVMSGKRCISCISYSSDISYISYRVNK